MRDLCNISISSSLCSVISNDEIKDKRIEELERIIRDRDIEIDRLKKEYRVGLGMEIVELEGLVENLEGL